MRRFSRSSCRDAVTLFSASRDPTFTLFSASSARVSVSVSCLRNSVIVRLASSRSARIALMSFSILSTTFSFSCAAFSPVSARLARSDCSVRPFSALTNRCLSVVRSLFCSCPRARSCLMVVMCFISVLDNFWPSSSNAAIWVSFSASFLSCGVAFASPAATLAEAASCCERYVSLDCRASMRSR